MDKAKRAFTGQIRNPIVRRIGNIIITILFVYSRIMRWLFGKKDLVESLRGALNNSRVLPWTSKYTPRLYIYSRKDELVPYKEVESHAREAAALGLDVRQETFEDSAHVAHARADPERYWGAIERTWTKACNEEKTRVT